MAPRWPTTALPVALLLLASTAAADYKESYKKGIEAVGRRDWPEVARLMKEAVAEQPKEGEQVKLYGMRFETYLPQYYLGLAHFHTGDCRSALQAWSISSQQGAVKGAEKKTLLQNQVVCQTRLADDDKKRSATAQLAQATAGAESELAKAEQAARGAASLQSDPDLGPIWGQDAALRDGHKQANDALAAARAKLEQAKKGGNASLATEAASLASQASQLYATLTQVADARRQDLRRQAEAARPASAVPSAQITPGIPAELLAGAQAFFDARYAEASERLARAGVSGPAGSHAALLRGAARFMLYVTGGQQEESLRTAAAADVRVCRRLNPRLSPDPEIFSPRFVEFFRQNR